MHVRSAEWRFGGFNPDYRPAASWFLRHEPTVDRWITELEAANDPVWRSAEHAAFCLVSHRMNEDASRAWECSDVAELLSHDLSEARLGRPHGGELGCGSR